MTEFARRTPPGTKSAPRQRRTDKSREMHGSRHAKNSKNDSEPTCIDTWMLANVSDEQHLIFRANACEEVSHLRRRCQRRFIDHVQLLLRGIGLIAGTREIALQGVGGYAFSQRDASVSWFRLSSTFEQVRCSFIRRHVCSPDSRPERGFVLTQKTVQPQPN
jgi:hypothetical protein